jgi:hypothetical protein
VAGHKVRHHNKGNVVINSDRHAPRNAAKAAKSPVQELDPNLCTLQYEINSSQQIFFPKQVIMHAQIRKS